MTGWLLSVVNWAGAHPQAAGILVALIACLESLAFIGLVVPGAVLMLGAGALVGVGSLNFWSTLAWAVGGAVLGDGVSYWIGHRYRDSLKKLKWISARPELLEQGEAFLHRHGGKSILLARFVGPVRPIVPVVAGMLGMRPVRFYGNNILSALIWAPAHLIPGMAFGASLALAGQVASRLALGLVLGIAFVWFVMWSASHGYRWLSSRAHVWTTRSLTFGKRHPGLSWLVGDLVDPSRPVSHPLALWFLILVGGTWLLFGIIEDVANQDSLVYAGQSFYRLLQQLRTPVGDQLLVAVTELGDSAVISALVAIVSAWLVWKRAWRDVQYWLVAVLFGVMVVEALKYAFHMPRPVPIYTGIEANSFPSSHATLSTVVYGFLAVLCAPAFSRQWRWLPYAFATMLIGVIAFSRLYLGVHWLADVAAGISLGLVWITLLSIARARRLQDTLTGRGLPAVALSGLLVAGTWHIQAQWPTDLTRYAARDGIHEMTAAQWWASGWQTLPAHRVDLSGDTEQPLNVQFAGSPGGLEQSLASHGWRRPVILTLRSSMRLLLPTPTLHDLPVLPQLNGGRAEQRVLVKDVDGDKTHACQYVLRLWPASYHLGQATLWVGSVAEQSLARLPLVSYPYVSGGYDEALSTLQPALATYACRMANRAADHAEEDQRWSGHTLLIMAVTAPAGADGVR